MLLVTIDVVPQGDEKARRTLRQIEIANDLSGDDEAGNYDVTLTDEHGHTDRARVEGFSRHAPELRLVLEAVYALHNRPKETACPAP